MSNILLRAAIETKEDLENSLVRPPVTSLVIQPFQELEESWSYSVRPRKYINQSGNDAFGL